MNGMSSKQTVLEIENSSPACAKECENRKKAMCKKSKVKTTSSGHVKL